jgi:RNA polymerase sigma-70 factor (ECF subfamily)
VEAPTKPPSDPAGLLQNELDDEVAARLIRRYQAHDPKAFVELHGRYRAAVYRTALARLPCESDAEDVTQQVFCKVLQALPAYRPEQRSFRRWLLTVTKNTAADHRRRARHWEATAPEELDRSLDALEDTAPAWGDATAVHEVVAELSETERRVLALLYRLDLSPRDAAVALGSTEAAVYKLHSRTLAKVRSGLRSR